MLGPVVKFDEEDGRCGWGWIRLSTLPWHDDGYLHPAQHLVGLVVLGIDTDRADSPSFKALIDSATV